MAVEVHQFAADSADASFDFSLAGGYQRPDGIPLNPGVNRLVVQAMSGLNGQGEIVSTDFVDVWYDDGSVQRVTTDFPTGETTWTAANGPYQIEGELTVPTDAVLRIEPGTSVFFAAGGAVNRQRFVNCARNRAQSNSLYKHTRCNRRCLT